MRIYYLFEICYKQLNIISVGYIYFRANWLRLLFPPTYMTGRSWQLLYSWTSF